MGLPVRSIAFSVCIVVIGMTAPQAIGQEDRLAALEEFIRATRTSFASWKGALLCDRPALQGVVDQCRARMDYAATLIKSPRRAELPKIEAIAAEASKLQEEAGQVLPTWGRCVTEAVNLHSCLAGFALEMIRLRAHTRRVAPAD
jgi:hypothetical protein